MAITSQSSKSNELDCGLPGTISAARMAQEANVKTLVLIHMGHDISQHGLLEQTTCDIRKRHSGQVISLEELMKLGV